MDEEFRFKDTIIRVRCDIDIGDLVRDFIIEKRQILDRYISKNPDFETSLEPIELKNPPEIANIMANAAKKAGVGPLAAVAGTFSELLVDEAIKRKVGWVIAENGGDICMYGEREFAVSIFAGSSPLSNKIAVSLNPGQNKYGICTSSATVGHSMSFGKTDAVTVFAKSTPIADAFATAIANKVDGIEDGIGAAEEFMGRGIDGVLIIIGDKIAKIGKVPKIVAL